MSQNLMGHRMWCNTDSWCVLTDSDNHYRLSQPPCCLWCLSVYIWLFVSDLWPLIIAHLSCRPLRWAQFFICPLMIRDAIDREVEAVDSGESWCICASLLRAEKLNFSCFTWSPSAALLSSPHAALFHTIDHRLFLSSQVFLSLLLSLRVPAG